MFGKLACGGIIFCMVGGLSMAEPGNWPDCMFGNWNCDCNCGICGICGICNWEFWKNDGGKLPGCKMVGCLLIVWKLCSADWSKLPGWCDSYDCVGFELPPKLFVVHAGSPLDCDGNPFCKWSKYCLYSLNPSLS